PAASHHRPAQEGFRRADWRVAEGHPGRAAARSGGGAVRRLGAPGMGRPSRRPPGSAAVPVDLAQPPARPRPRARSVPQAVAATFRRHAFRAGPVSDCPRARQTMDRTVYAIEAAIEETHWWFVGRRELFSREIARLGLVPSSCVADVGTG